MALFLFLMTADLNVALLSRIGKKWIESLLGLSMQDRIHRTICMKLCSGILLKLMNGRVRDHLNLKV
jgi:hypothetical protein